MPQNKPDKVPNIIIHKNQYTGVFRLLTKIYPQMGIEAKSVDMTNLDELRNAIDDQTKAFFFETPSNPSIDIIDIEECAQIIHESSGKCIADNTFASPALQRPLEYGVDFVVESLTKYINGHGDCLGGAIIGPKNELQNMINRSFKDPITALLLKNSNLTKTQYESLLIDYLTENITDKSLTYENKTIFRSKKVSRGSFSRTLSQGRNNIISSIYTILLLSYVGIFDSNPFEKYIILAEKLSEYKLTTNNESSKESKILIRRLEIELFNIIKSLARPESTKPM